MISRRSLRAARNRSGGSLRPLAVAAATVAMALGAAACSSTSNPSGASTSTTANSSSSKKTLIVYSAQGYDQAVVKAFQTATGIPTKLDTNSTGPLLTQIEASKNNPHWGLLWVDGQTGFAQLDDEHMLLKGWEPNVNWNTLGKNAIPKDKSFVPTGITFMGDIAYTSKVVTSPPTSWTTLLSTKWKGAVGMNTPSQSGPTYPFIAGMMNYLGSVTKGKQYFEKLKTNGLVINSTNGKTLQALTSGQIKVALIQSSAAIGGESTAPSIKVSYLNPATTIPGNIGIDAKMTSTEIAEAKKFVEFVLSTKGQAVMKTGDRHGDSLYYPVLQGVQPWPTLPSIASVTAQHTDPYVWGPREASINSWFLNTITK